MMKKLLAIVLAAVLLLSLIACGGKSIVGKWVFGGNSFEFREDSTVSISVNGMVNDGTYTIEGDKIIVTAKTLLGETTKSFTYALKGNTLTITGDITLLGGLDVTYDFEKQK